MLYLEKGKRKKQEPYYYYFNLHFSCFLSMACSLCLFAGVDVCHFLIGLLCCSPFLTLILLKRKTIIEFQTTVEVLYRSLFSAKFLMSPLQWLVLTTTTTTTATGNWLDLTSCFHELIAYCPYMTPNHKLYGCSGWSLSKLLF